MAVDSLMEALRLSQFRPSVSVDVAPVPTGVLSVVVPKDTQRVLSVATHVPPKNVVMDVPLAMV